MAPQRTTDDERRFSNLHWHYFAFDKHLADDRCPPFASVVAELALSLLAGYASFDAGADDFLVKPLDLNELAARIRSACRRYAGRVREQLIHGNLHLDITGR